MARKCVLTQGDDISAASASAGGREGGFTLVEVLVGLSIMAVIGAAGFGVLDQVLRVQRQTEGRLERLADVQRAMFVFSLDLRQATNGSLEAAAGELVFSRSSPQGPLAIRYRLEGETLFRHVSHSDASSTRQALISGAETVSWRFWRQDVGWLGEWPPPSEVENRNPAAIEMELVLSPPGPAGALRRVVPLPAEAEK